MTPEEREEFQKLARPIMKFVAKKFHPHVHITITSNSAVLAEELFADRADAFIKD